MENTLSNVAIDRIRVSGVSRSLHMGLIYFDQRSSVACQNSNKFEPNRHSLRHNVNSIKRHILSNFIGGIPKRTHSPSLTNPPAIRLECIVNA